MSASAMTPDSTNLLPAHGRSRHPCFDKQQEPSKRFLCFHFQTKTATLPNPKVGHSGKQTFGHFLYSSLSPPKAPIYLAFIDYIISKSYKNSINCTGNARTAANSFGHSSLFGQWLSPALTAAKCGYLPQPIGAESDDYTAYILFIGFTCIFCSSTYRSRRSGR